MITLAPSPQLEEEVVVVATTRTGRRLEDQPTRVEVLGREEIEEKMLMTPGDIVMMLNEMGGLRVQTTSPSLGAASVRVQGMRGRYTRFLSDGLPLFGAAGRRPWPPADPADGPRPGGGHQGRRVVAVRRGRDGRRRQPASPGARPQSRSESCSSTAPAWARPTRRVLRVAPLAALERLPARRRPLAGAQTIVDDDGWADLAGYSRGVVRPRVFWDGGNGGSAFLATAASRRESRGRHDARRRARRPPARRTFEALDTRRYDVGATGQMLIAERTC